MNAEIKSKIEHAHALTSAMQMIVAFGERPDFLGGPLSVGQAIVELVRQGSFGVTVDELVAEWARIVGDLK